MILWLGAGSGAAVMIGFYHLERHVCATYPLKMSRIVRGALYGVALIALFPLLVMPFYYHCPVAACMGSALSYHPLMSERLLEAAYSHHQELKQADQEARDNCVMRRA